MGMKKDPQEINNKAEEAADSLFEMKLGFKLRQKSKNTGRIYCQGFLVECARRIKANGFIPVVLPDANGNPPPSKDQITQTIGEILKVEENSEKEIVCTVRVFNKNIGKMLNDKLLSPSAIGSINPKTNKVQTHEINFFYPLVKR